MSMMRYRRALSVLAVLTIALAIAPSESEAAFEMIPAPPPAAPPPPPLPSAAARPAVPATATSPVTVPAPPFPATVAPAAVGAPQPITVAPLPAVATSPPVPLVPPPAAVPSAPLPASPAIAPLPQSVPSPAPAAPPVSAPAVPAWEHKTVRGEGVNIPLSRAIRRIVPREIVIGPIDPTIRDRHLSYSGYDRPWRVVLAESLSRVGLTSRQDGLLLMIEHDPAKPSPGPEVTPLATSAAPIEMENALSKNRAPKPASELARLANAPGPAPMGAPAPAANFDDAMAARTWAVRPNTTLQETVTAWARSLGYPPPDDKTGFTWRIDFGATFTGTYLQALEWLTSGFGNADKRPDWRFSRTNLVTVLLLK